MRLATFISGNIPEILAEWDAYAVTMTPAADSMSFKDLRDHAEIMLVEIARDLATSQSSEAQVAKSHGSSDNTSSPAARHGHMRHADHFTLMQLHAEFRSLRATVLRMWLPLNRDFTGEVLFDVIRFNEAIDQAVAESIATFSGRTE